MKKTDRHEFGAPPLGKGPLAVERAATRLKPSRSEAEAAVRTLLAWSGDDPGREGLSQTPQRVVEAFGEYFSGYGQDAIALLQDATLDDVGGYDDIVMLNGIDVLSHCEHHITPFTGKAWVAYLPDKKVTGLSRLIRVVETFSRRLQTQEALTAQIADAIDTGLEPQGVAVLIEAEHQCIAARGVRQSGVGVVTSRFLGRFATDPSERARFLSLVRR